eukprot:TRINITY_DN265_c0_g1_i6.p1 TRINITY_DN265_c0_g1~~TRINITY_DN265_c0_g1_i6.p1  ORF type:complete len:694 (+),score=122.66 TRINITY_DN265_c0_g1_i6:285-2366(+)
MEPDSMLQTCEDVEGKWEAKLDISLSKYDQLLDNCGMEQLDEADRSTAAASSCQDEVDTFLDENVSQIGRETACDQIESNIQVGNLAGKVSYYGLNSHTWYFKENDTGISRERSSDDYCTALSASMSVRCGKNQFGKKALTIKKRAENKKKLKNNEKFLDKLIQKGLHKLAEWEKQINVISQQLGVLQLSIRSAAARSAEKVNSVDTSLLQDEVSTTTGNRVASKVIENDASSKIYRNLDEDSCSHSVASSIRDKVDDISGSGTDTIPTSAVDSLHLDEVCAVIGKSIVSKDIQTVLSSKTGKSIDERCCNHYKIGSIQDEIVEVTGRGDDKVSNVNEDKRNSAISYYDSVQRNACEEENYVENCKNDRSSNWINGFFFQNQRATNISGVKVANFSESVNITVKESSAVTSSLQDEVQVVTGHCGASNAIQTDTSGETNSDSGVCSRSLSVATLIQEDTDSQMLLQVEVHGSRDNSIAKGTDSLAATDQAKKKQILDQLIRSGWLHLELLQSKQKILQEKTGINRQNFTEMIENFKTTYEDEIVGNLQRQCDSSRVDFCTEMISTTISMMELMIAEIDNLIDNLIQDEDERITGRGGNSATVETNRANEASQVIDKPSLDQIIRKGWRSLERFQDKSKLLQEKTGTDWISELHVSLMGMYNEAVVLSAMPINKAVEIIDLEIGKLDEALRKCA